MAGLLREIPGLAKQAQGLLRPAHPHQRDALVNQSSRNQRYLAGLPALDRCGLGGVNFGGMVRKGKSVTTLGDVDPWIEARRRGKPAQGRDRVGRLLAMAARRQAVGELQPVVDLVGKEGPERAVSLGGLVPLLARLIEPRLDGQPLLTRQPGG